MSTASAVCYEVRCEKCYQSNYLPVGEAGNQFHCKVCGVVTIAPQPTHETLERAVGIDPSDLELPVAQFAEDAPLSKEQIARIAKQRVEAAQAKKHPVATPDEYAASRLQRFAAQILDAIIAAIAFGVGMVTAMVLAQMQLIQIPSLEGVPQEQVADFVVANFPVMAVLVLGFFPVGLTMIQWSMIASHGQTMGKKLMFVKIVDDQGNPPGFVQGVITRNWIKNLLCMIPLFGLIDILCIFTSSRRCIHDLMAGTYVVSCR